MIAVIFEVRSVAERAHEYFDIAAELKPLLQKIDGFISIERFESLATKGKLGNTCRFPSSVMKKSFVRDEIWRSIERLRPPGRNGVFAEYRIRVASVM